MLRAYVGQLRGRVFVSSGNLLHVLVVGEIGLVGSDRRRVKVEVELVDRCENIRTMTIQ